MSDTVIDRLATICTTDKGGTIEFVETQLGIANGQLTSYLDTLLKQGRISSYDTYGPFFSCKV